MLAGLRRVLSKPGYAALACLVALAAFLFATWAPNLGLIRQVLFSGDVALGEKASLLFSLSGSITTNFSWLSAAYTLSIALLLGVNAALFTFYIQKRRGGTTTTGAVSSIGGLISSVFGLGCAACGTVLISPLLALFGGSALLSALPLGGEEFGIIGAFLLAFSALYVARRINDPLVCTPEPTPKVRRKRT